MTPEQLNTGQMKKFDRVTFNETEVRFNGADYVPERDNGRLTSQLNRIYKLMADHEWRTLVQIEEVTGDPTPSISAQLRHLRKKRFGSHVIDRRHLGNGLYEYRMRPVWESLIFGKEARSEPEKTSPGNGGASMNLAVMTAPAAKHIGAPLYGGVRFLDTPSMANVDRLDRGAMPLIDQMHTNGILVDKGHFADLYQKLDTRRRELIEEAKVLVGHCAPDLSLASPQQVAKLLYIQLGLVPPGRPKRTKDGMYSTEDDMLSAMKGLHPVVNTVLNFREVNTLINVFVRPIPLLVHNDGRLRTIFKVTRTSTGRLSSGDRKLGLPNLQNIPIRGDWGREIRNGFIAGRGNVLVSLDLMQIEMRIAADFAVRFFGDYSMARVFQEGADIHTRTAVAMFKLSIERIEYLAARVERQEATEDEKFEYSVFKRDCRAPAKNLGFGVLYGLTAEGLQRNILAEGGSYFTVEECQAYIDAWFKAYPGIKDWMMLQFRRVFQFGMVWDLFGRIRLIPEGKSVLRDKVAEGLREAGNMPIQGTAQGLIKLAMAEITPVVEFFQCFKSETCLPLLQIHDEMVFECSRSIAGDFAHAGREIMRAVDRGQLFVPVDSSADMAERQGELK